MTRSCSRPARHASPHSLRCMLAVAALLTIATTAHAGAPLSYDMELTLTETWNLVGEVTVEGTATQTWPNLVFRNYQGTGLSVDRVEREGIEVPWRATDPWTLVVPGHVDAGQSFSVTIAFSASVPRLEDACGYGTFARTADTVVLGAAYPMLAVWDEGWHTPPVLDWGDAVVAEVADYRARIHVPSGWQVIAGGEVRQLEGGTADVVGARLRELAVVLVRAYDSLEAPAGDARVRSWHRPDRRAPAAEALETAVLSLFLCERLFAPYPFPSLDIVEVPLREAAGIEYPGLILVGQAYYESYPHQPLFFTMIIAHEVAHQWWYAMVGNDQVTEPWVDEALATYTSGLLFEAVGRLDEIYTYWQRTYAAGLRRNPHAGVDSPLWAFPDGAGYGGIVYSGGALMLHELRLAMGDERFIGALRTYLDTHRWSLARGADLLAAMEAASTVPIAPIFDRYLSAP